MGDGLPRYAGAARIAGSPGETRPASLSLEPESFLVGLESAPVRASYRDLTTIALQQGTGLVTIGKGSGAMTLILERFGPFLGPLVRDLRTRRLRQQMADRFCEMPEGAPVELVEFAAGLEPGQLPAPETPSAVGQLALHRRGFVLAPVDERQPWISVRRADVGQVTAEPLDGTVRVEPDSATGFELRGLGPAVTRYATALDSLRSGAFADASAIVESLIPDAGFGARRHASSLLVDGRPADPAALGDAWPLLERAVLSEPTFAESYRLLLQRAGGARGAHRWIALAPEEPGKTESPKVWFLVALPGNLVAMELVSEGAHATYCFRAVPRAGYDGTPQDRMLPSMEAAVAGISAALVDARFLREPIGLPDGQLAGPGYARYRLALAALPSLAQARKAFVARLVHSSVETWSAALDDLIRWHAACRDDAAEWPGRAAQEAQIETAASGDEGQTMAEPESPA